MRGTLGNARKKVCGHSIRTAYPDESNGESIVFIHGACVGAWYWDNFLPYFAERGYSCFAPDLIGHGESDGVSGEFGNTSILEYVGYLEGLLDNVFANGKMPIVVGHSMGGIIAQKLAERRTLGALALVAAAPPAGISYWWGKGLHLSSDAAKIGIALFFRRPYLPSRALVASSLMSKDDAFIDRIYARFTPESAQAGIEIVSSRIDVDETRVKAPVLVVSGGMDNIINPMIADAISEKYDADRWNFPGLGHSLILEDGWESVASALYDWLNKKVILSSR